MNTNRTRLLFLALSLLLLLSAVPFAAFADVSPRGEEHSHDYETSYSNVYEYVSNSTHKKKTYKVETCFCGDTVTTLQSTTTEAHYAVTGSKTYLYSYLGESGMISVYQLTCRHCGGTYTVSEVSQPAN